MNTHAINPPEHGVPTPAIHDWNRPFFENAARGTLTLQRCLSCNELIYYPRIVCPRCMSPDYEWEELSGGGTVYSFAIVWRPQHPAFLPRIPITLAIVELAEGPQMVTNLVDCSPDDVHIGMEVGVVFETIADGIALPKFAPPA